MSIWPDKPIGRSVLLVAVALAAIIPITLFVTTRDRPQHSVGWETEDSAKEPFRTGVITNGQPPADFEIAILKPGPDSPMVLDPGERCEFVVEIRMLDANAPNATVPPSFVFVQFAKEKRMAGGDWLKPSAMGARSFTYSGKLYAPMTVGEYKTSVEVKYMSLDLSDGQPDDSNLVSVQGVFSGSISGGGELNAGPYQKAIQGPEIHVRN